MFCTYTRQYKIGITDDIVKRRKQLQDYLFHVGIDPDTLILKDYKEVNNARLVEKSLHQYFRKHRTFGEWFVVDDIDFASLVQRFDKN